MSKILEEFYFSKMNFPNYYPEQKMCVFKLFTVMGGKFKFSSQVEIWNISFGEVKIK